MGKYTFTDCKPLESPLTDKQVISLEHKYRLLLKKSGFNDIEMWDNKPKAKVKKVKFIKGHLRIGFRSGRIKDTYNNYTIKARNYFDYYRVIGLYAYNCNTIPDKYKKILQDLSLTGNLALSLRNTKSIEKHATVLWYIKKNLNKMIKFVRELEDE